MGNVSPRHAGTGPASFQSARPDAAPLACHRLHPDERNGSVRGVGEITSVSAMDRLLPNICDELEFTRD